MMNFGFTNTSAVPTNNYLKAWTISDVEFKGCEIVSGKTKEDKVWKAIVFKFADEKGAKFEHRAFLPSTEQDAVRREIDGANGGKVQFPSNFEVFKTLIAQTIQTLNPAGWEKFVAASAKFKSVDDIATVTEKILSKSVGAKTQLKLTGRNSDGHVYANIPTIVRVNKDGELWVCDKYIGENLTFSDYEESQRQKFLNAKPTTKVEEKNPIDTPVTGGSEDIDLSGFDDLEL